MSEKKEKELKCQHGFFLDPNGHHVYPLRNEAVPMKDADKVYNITEQEHEKAKSKTNNKQYTVKDLTDALNNY